MFICNVVVVSISLWVNMYDFLYSVVVITKTRKHIAATVWRIFLSNHQIDRWCS